MKNCKRRTIFSWIFALLLLVPMFSIAIRCLYVVFNKNAYQSYSNFNSETHEYVNVDSFDDLIVGNTYKFISNNDGFSTITNVNSYMQVENVNIISASRTITEEQAQSITRFGLYLYNNNTLLRFNDDSGIQNIAFNSGFATFTFTYLGLINVNTSNTFESYFDSTVYSNNLTNYGNTLDNVFEYSIQQFVDKHGNGLINFFALLQDYFMQSTSANALYFTFANWCLNYVLLVSCVWLLFSVLMWFINYCNYMLNTSFRKGHGD